MSTKHVEASGISKSSKKVRNQAKLQEDGSWVLPEGYQVGRRFMFPSDEVFAEYKRWRLDNSYQKKCAEKGIIVGARRGPRGPWKYDKICSKCGQDLPTKEASRADAEPSPGSPSREGSGDSS